MKRNNILPPSAPEESRLENREDQALIPHKTDWLRIGQFTFSSLAALTLLVFFFISILVTVIRDSITSDGLAMGNDLSSYLFLAGLGGMGLLMIPSAISAGRRLFGKGTPRQLRWKVIARVGYLAPLLLLLGYGVQSGPGWARGFLPLIHVLANSTAVLLILDIARRKLPNQSVSRFWGSFIAGLGLTPLVSFILEIMILFGIGLVWALLLGAMPGFRQELVDLANLLQNSSVNSQDLQLALGDLAARPGVLLTLFSYVAIMIPVVEELLKPAAVWLLVRRVLQPWEGFVLGATSGAGYALFENLTIGAAAEVWTFVALTRLGTAAVHIFTTGLVGWGLASASKEKKYGRLAATFFTAVLVHGVWNGLNILSAVNGFAAVKDRLGSMGSALADFAPVGLIILALGSFFGLLRANKFFRRAIMAGSN